MFRSYSSRIIILLLSIIIIYSFPFFVITLSYFFMIYMLCIFNFLLHYKQISVQKNYNGQTDRRSLAVLTFTVLCNTRSDNDRFLFVSPWLHPDSGCAGCNCIGDFKRTGGSFSPQEMSQVTDSQVRKDSLMYSVTGVVCFCRSASCLRGIAEHFISRVRKFQSTRKYRFHVLKKNYIYNYTKFVKNLILLL